jgi:hypothetical protein
MCLAGLARAHGLLYIQNLELYSILPRSPSQRCLMWPLLLCDEKHENCCERKCLPLRDFPSFSPFHIKEYITLLSCHRKKLPLGSGGSPTVFTYRRQLHLPYQTNNQMACNPAPLFYPYPFFHYLPPNHLFPTYPPFPRFPSLPSLPSLHSPFLAGKLNSIGNEEVGCGNSWYSTPGWGNTHSILRWTCTVPTFVGSAQILPRHFISGRWLDSPQNRFCCDFDDNITPFLLQWYLFKPSYSF